MPLRKALGITAEKLQKLRRNWQGALATFGVAASAARRLFSEVAEPYASAGRHYHTLEHIEEILQTIHSLRKLASNLPAIELAAWFHDIVYNSRSKDNEEKSAARARDMLGRLGIAADVIALVEAMIRATKNHRAAQGAIDSHILLDADLAILGASAPRYARYARAIRQEYNWVGEDRYRQGRKQVLQSFLERPRLYFTERMRQAREAQARRNIRNEIASLSK